MSEPEELIIEAAEHATSVALGLWRRHAEQPAPGLTLDELAHRLELFAAALFDVTVDVVVADPPARPNFLARIFGAAPSHLVDLRAMPATDGRYLRLPRTLEEVDADDALAMYRLWAAEQAVRVSRQSPHCWQAIPDGPARCLFWLAEAAVCDRMLAESCPGLVDLLVREREHALARRAGLDVFTPPERAVEQRLRGLLGSHPARLPAAFADLETPQDARRWAETVVDSLPDGRWRGIPPLRLWGRLQPPELAASEQAEHAAVDDRQAEPSGRSQKMERRPEVREPEEGEDDDGEGTWMVPMDDYQESVQDPMGLQRPTDRDDEASPDDLADALSNLDEARLVRTSDPAREVLESEDPAPRSPSEAGGAAADGIRYPEWDWRRSAYTGAGAVVRPRRADAGAAGWAPEVLSRHAGLIERVRRCFAQLRPRRVRLRRQPDGDEIDIEAYVEAHADRVAGRPPAQRLYQTVRPRRRDVAISLLVDISASTDSWVARNKRIIDVEKEALLVVCEALEVLGDPYAISAFSGRGPGHVSVLSLKEFGQPYSAAVRRRIGALQPDRYTRVGAAIRHATAELTAQSAQHRLLLVLSDGKPNDLDRYESRYGVEDARQAVNEARLQELDVFCLTIDRRAPSYMPQIYGPGAFSVLNRPELLPRVLVDVVRRLLSH